MLWLPGQDILQRLRQSHLVLTGQWGLEQYLWTAQTLRPYKQLVVLCHVEHRLETKSKSHTNIKKGKNSNNFLQSINEGLNICLSGRLQCLCATTWATLAVFSGSVSSGKSGSISATPSPSSIGCSSSDTWQRPREQPQASCQLHNIHCSKQGHFYRASSP